MHIICAKWRFAKDFTGCNFGKKFAIKLRINMEVVHEED